MFILVTSACIVTYSHVHSCIYEYESTQVPKQTVELLTLLVDICFPRVFIERFATEIMSLFNQTRTKTKECQLGRRKAISHSEIEFEPGGSGAHCGDKTSHMIHHTRLDSE